MQLLLPWSRYGSHGLYITVLARPSFLEHMLAEPPLRHAGGACRQSRVTVFA